MSLRTVKVPVPLEPAFAKAEAIVSGYFARRHDDAERGTIDIAGERYVLIRAASLSVDFFATVRDLFGPGRETEAEEFTRNILFDLAHAVGRSDAKDFHARLNLTDPIERLTVGPVMFAHTGWAFVDIAAESVPSPDENCYLVYDHPYSFEAEAWLRAGRPREFPSCIMNAGYSSGWCEESFGVVLVATEVLCRARGDACCRFVMAHPTRIEARVQEWASTLPAHLQGKSWQIPDFFSRKRVEEELRRATVELEQRVQERTAELQREMGERAEMERRMMQTQKLEAVGKLAGGIAHDFNNLMAVVLASCELLTPHLKDDAYAKGRLELIEAAGQRAADLTKQLLAFSRGQPPGREALDLNRVVRDVATMLGRVIGEHIRVELDLADDIGDVEGDRGQLEQVLVNLMLNARDAMPTGGTLTLSTRRSPVAAGSPWLGDAPAGPYVVLAVRDTGSGMDAATVARVFEPFFTTKGGGTGLGLATAYGIVRQHRGAISAESAPGAGSTFRVLLPSASPPSQPAAGPSPKRAPLPRGHETVLLAEDQPPLRAAIAEMLGGLGYHVIVAADPEEALALAEHAEIDLLLTDVRMPRMSGPELARRLTLRFPRVRVLYMSGYAENLQGLASAGAELLEKPFTFKTLANRLREVLDRPPGPPSPG